MFAMRCMAGVFIFMGAFSYVSAAPSIDVDSTRATVDTVIQGTVSRIRHVFRIRNSGDSNLVIEKVKAG